METGPENSPPTRDHHVLALIAVLVTIAMVWIVKPTFAAIVWGFALAVVFRPVHEWFRRMTGDRASLAAVVTVTLVFLLIVIPAILVATLIIVQIPSFLAGTQNIVAGSLEWLGNSTHYLARGARWLMLSLGYADMDSVQAAITKGMADNSTRIAGQALVVSQGIMTITMTVLMALYLAFFVLRDGHRMAAMVRDSVPLEPQHTNRLGQEFVAVTRATLRGGSIVALVQGAIGGIAFWFVGIPTPVLWAVIMAFASLVPVVGTALIWFPAAVYLLVTGQLGSALVLVATGAFIATVDNLLRPILVGRDTGLPDYIILLTTIGGLAMWGLTGIIAGPMIAVLFVTTWRLYARSLHNQRGE